MEFWIQKPFHFLQSLIPLLVFFLFQLTKPCSSYDTPLNCTETSRLCTSFLAFTPSPNQTLAVIMSMFDVLPQDVTVEGNGRDYVFVRKNCSCAASPVSKYLTSTTYTVRENGGSLYSMVVDAYGGLGYLSNFSRPARVGSVVSLQLFCGCSNGLWNYLLSYVMKEGDSIGLLASRFGVSMDSIETVNGINNSDNVTIGALYYIPLNSVPGEPYPVKNDTPLAPAPAPAPLFVADVAVNQSNHKSHVPLRWIIASLGVGLTLIIAVIGFFVYSRSSICYDDVEGSRTKDPKDGKVPHKFHILRTTSFCCGSRRFCCKSDDWRETTGESSDRHMNIPKVIGTDVFDIEKPVVFQYEEIFSATDCFSESNLLGHGMYGAVYYGLLRDQEVAIKRMTETKTKEFIAEMKVLCKVHHTNLVELIGYAATDDELFLIYEYAQKGSLKSHLHDPQNKGHTTLSWIMRVQIALDTARGMEYIHEHTKPHYVHRDIKTSNILLDGAFKAKISDFGLAKLVGRTNDDEASVTRVVGTYGYLAPEYLRDGLATAKSDVYAFGVVLFEIISGKDAIVRTEAVVTKNSERRSLASVMLAALKNAPESISSSSLRDHVDPNLMDLFPHDCVFKMAMLGKQCVEDDPVLRPDMKQVVISLSHILLSSVEWEATLAGNSQVFSGLVQGR
ncbi:lysM domain receptor-like kinase 3 isoform X2 [Cynara cardunculus var. scolymus]|uniref:lysM domain receptor-like kinase 3 isoform X2 n=1 Tax=Cynara cardunculus var. scolymus TaxID=59895 RepID=UPI000D623203|nr:lysM domain receptor-like kinase 3 isoform X2 [Cynara cardunculus var. scolymus]